MIAPYVIRLRTEIEHSVDATQRAMLTAELGCYWARVGEIEAAEQLNVELRRIYSDGRDIRVSVLIMCLEGLIQYFKNLSPIAFDRLARAKLLSEASGNSELIAFASAWLAHMHFNNNRFVEMLSAIESCFRALSVPNASAESRVSLVLGDAFLYVGDHATAKVWHDRARNLALRLGDRAAIGALIYNRTALHVFGARVDGIKGNALGVNIEQLNLEIRSAISYEFAADLKSLKYLLDSAKVGVLVMNADFKQAAILIQALLDGRSVTAGSGLELTLRADLAYCHAEVDEPISAKHIIETLLVSDLDSYHYDDKVLAFNSIRLACDRCAMPRQSEMYSSLLLVAIDRQSTQIADLRGLLKKFGVDYASRFK